MMPLPPKRPPRFAWDGDGVATLSSARGLLAALCVFARLSDSWRDGDGRKIALRLEGEGEEAATLVLAGALEGRIELSVDPSLWVRAEVHLGGRWFGRGWIERSYEECEIWPDGSEGVQGPGVEDDPPGRLSKRGAWVQFDAAQWPGYRGAARFIGFEQNERGIGGAAGGTRP